jgi:hypothetical protein
MLHQSTKISDQEDWRRWSFSSEALTPMTYAETDLKQIARSSQTSALASNQVSFRSYAPTKPYFLASVEIGMADPWRFKSGKGSRRFGQNCTQFN